MKSIDKCSIFYSHHYYIGPLDPQEKSNKSLFVSEILLTFAFEHCEDGSWIYPL